VPASQKLEGYVENLSGSADGEITLPLQAVALLQKHELLDESILLADLATCSPRWVEEEAFFLIEWTNLVRRGYEYGTPRAPNFETKSLRRNSTKKVA
jgi:hypothetical protein